MKENNEWSNPKNCTMQGPRPRWFITGTHAWSTDISFSQTACRYSNISFVVFRVHRTVVSSVFSLCLVFRALHDDFVVHSKVFSDEEVTSCCRVQRAHKWEFNAVQGIYARVRPFSFHDQVNWSRTVWTAMETTLLTLCCITLADSAAATCPLDIMHVLVSLSFFDASPLLCLLMFFQIFNMVGSKVRPSPAAKTHLFILFFFPLFSLLNAYY